MEKLDGVFPCYKNQFKAGATKETSTPVANVESFSVAFDNGVEEWTPYETQGWTKRLMTAKSVTISISGKRTIGDPGNDYIAGLALKNGTDAQGYLGWEFPDGTTIDFSDAVFNVTELGAGDSTGVGTLAADVMSNGKPEVTQPAA